MREALGRRGRMLGIKIRRLTGLNIYSAAKKFKAGFFYDFANVEGSQ